MHRRYFLSLLFAIAIIYLFPINSYSDINKKLGSWYIAKYPPFYITEGEFKDQGTIDKIDDYLIKRLKGYSFKNKTGNISRIIYDMKKKKNVCTSLFIFTPKREKNMYFSIPCLIVLPQALITTKNKLKFFGNKKNISLNKILQNKNLKMGMVSDRSFGPILDSIIEKYKEKSNIYITKGGVSDVSKTLLRMLLRGRIDYILEYPESLMSHLRTYQIGSINDFAIIPLEENKQPIIAHVACTKNKWGYNIVKEVNSILLKARKTKEYKDIVKTWVPPESLNEFNKMYDNVFLKDKRTTINNKIN